MVIMSYYRFLLNNLSQIGIYKILGALSRTMLSIGDVKFSD